MDDVTTAVIQISPSLSLPVEAVTQTFAFLGRRGSGKSYAAMKLAEGMLDARAQIVAIDPVGVWFSLRIAKDGTGDGYDVPIFGGSHGDIPLEPGAGALIADLIVDRSISAVLDVSSFRKNERKRFATAFAEQLFHRKKQARSPLHIFVEEAQVFVPQRVMGDEARMVGAFEDLTKLGRNFGLGITLISQRAQSVNKDALNMTEALFVLQTNGSQERKALEAWIVEQGVTSKAIVDELPSLPIGTAYLWSPQWLRKLEKIKIGQRTTYNASATPTAGHRQVEPRPLSPAELADVQKSIAATIAKANADDPKALRVQIAMLERRLQDASVAPATIERVEVPVLTERIGDDLREVLSKLVDTLNAYTSVSDTIKEALLRVPLPTSSRNVFSNSETTEPKFGIHYTEGAPPSTRVQAGPNPGTDPAVKAGARRMLQSLARYGGQLTKQQFATLADVNRSSGTFSEYLNTLRTRNLIVDSASNVMITPEGADFVGTIVCNAPLSPQEICAMFSPKLKAGARRMLEILVKAHPKSMLKVDLAEKAGVNRTSGTFSEYLGTLRKNGLIEDDQRSVSASPTLFLSP